MSKLSKICKNKIKIRSKISSKDLKDFSKNLRLKTYDQNFNFYINRKKVSKTYAPELKDLFILYHLIIDNKCTCVLEFGSGWSSYIFYNSIKYLKKKNSIIKFRSSRPFFVYSVENEKKFLKISFNRIKDRKKNIIQFFFSKLKNIYYNNSLVLKYEKIPNCNPDFIYIDGPDQTVDLETQKISYKNSNIFMPIISNVLEIECYLQSGTIVCVDGRGAQASFLKRELKRNWIYYYSQKSDQHFFYLNDKSFGRINDLLLKFKNIL